MSDQYVICYDIANPRRLGRVHRQLQRSALAIQYSVYFFSGSEARLGHLIDAVLPLIDPRKDDLRVYPLPTRGLRLRLGKAVMPVGIQIGGLPTAW